MNHVANRLTPSGYFWQSWERGERGKMSRPKAEGVAKDYRVYATHMKQISLVLEKHRRGLGEEEYKELVERELKWAFEKGWEMGRKDAPTTR